MFGSYLANQNDAEILKTIIASEFVGIEIERDRGNRTLKVSQPNYITKVIAKFGMENANLSSVPAEPGLNLSKNHVCNDKNDCMSYHVAVGLLLFEARVYLQNIEYAVIVHYDTCDLSGPFWHSMKLAPERSEGDKFTPCQWATKSRVSYTIL